MEIALEMKRATKIFQVREGMFGRRLQLLAVDNVDFSLPCGASLGLVGESGCGKSTLGRLACGLEALSGGERLFHGEPLPPAGAGSSAAGRIQMVFQDPASSLNPRMSVLASVAEPLAARGEGKGAALHEAREMLALVGLKDMGQRYPHQFSGGQRQRIAVARALVSRPDIIVCDEPVSALDASVQAQILNLLREAREKFNPAYLFISHDLAVVGFMCPRILVMYLGQIVEEAARDELFAHAAHPYSRALLEAMPKGREAWARGAGQKILKPLPGELPSPLDPPSGCHFHPRCDRAKPICAEEAPPWKIIGENWRARCHFPEA